MSNMRIVIKPQGDTIKLTVEHGDVEYDLGTIDLSDKTMTEYVVQIGGSVPLSLKTSSDDGSSYEAGSSDYEYTHRAADGFGGKENG